MIKVKNTHFTSEKQDQVTTHSTINVWNSKLNTNWIYLHEKIQKKYWVRPSLLTVESKLKLHRLAGLTFSEMKFCKFTLVLKVKLRENDKNIHMNNLNVTFCLIDWYFFTNKSHNLVKVNLSIWGLKNSNIRIPIVYSIYQ